MRIRSTEVTKRSDYSEDAMIERLRTREDKIASIQNEPPRGAKTYIRNRQRDYRRVKRGVSDA